MTMQPGWFDRQMKQAGKLFDTLPDWMKKAIERDQEALAKQRGEKYVPLQDKFPTELRDQLLETTKEGSITDWTERIAKVAKKIELPIAQMDWHGSPQAVAHEVVRHAGQRNKLPQLQGLLELLAEALNKEATDG